MTGGGTAPAGFHAVPGLKRRFLAPVVLRPTGLRTGFRRTKSCRMPSATRAVGVSHLRPTWGAPRTLSPALELPHLPVL